MSDTVESLNAKQGELIVELAKVALEIAKNQDAVFHGGMSLTGAAMKGVEYISEELEHEVEELLDLL